MTPTVVGSIEALRGMAGAELGPGAPVTIEQARIDGFAELTGDRQWIHTDPERAAAGPFGAPTAHGFLTLSLVGPLSGALLRVEGTSMSVNYGLERVRFPSPVPVGASVQARARIVSVSDVAGGVQALIRVTVEIPGAPKPACVADTVVRFYA
ncbi:MaoC family dehydratase [Conexibacter stalactiti]|uniref:MaoC family dehydratase n=1 Tax=Conexibacter stalactiti TaxID=1940611 RepID=A0ABU4HKB6_9ACTN|nr:MaoC family dehydratase [Conexibacter stalactiti]MDW5593761.1 MaoC family dehydratase [Conexibacter stalactiti]MEC5034403.1 MaoC family dehydratase [Conexibacter stalactiti]